MIRLMRKSHIRVVPMLALALLFNKSVAATTAVAVDTEFLTNRATAAVLATVVSQESRWNDDQTQIHTYTVLDVQNDFKGKNRGKSITVRQLGGKVGNTGYYVAGQPRFRAGERVFVFLRPAAAKADCFRVVGMAQGKYSVLDDGTAVRDLSGLRLVGEEKGRAQTESRVPLETLIEKVKGIVSSQHGQREPNGEGGAR